MQRTENGFSTLEILISLSLLSFALTLFGNNQLGAMKRTKQAYYRAVAYTQIQSLVERLQAFTSLHQRSSQIALWNENNRRLLPNGLGVCNSYSNRLKISISWTKDGTHQVFSEFVL